MTFSPAAKSEPAAPEHVTELILRIFRANSALLAAGDQLVKGLGLTSARWQLLGSIADRDEALSVAQLAREIGVTRQSVQRIVNELETEGVVAFRPNPRHKRAQLVELTCYGHTVFERSMELQRPWAAALGRNLTASQVREVCATLEELLTALKGSEEAGPDATTP